MCVKQSAGKGAWFFVKQSRSKQCSTSFDSSRTLAKNLPNSLSLRPRQCGVEKNWVYLEMWKQIKIAPITSSLIFLLVKARTFYSSVRFHPSKKFYKKMIASGTFKPVTSWHSSCSWFLLASYPFCLCLKTSIGGLHLGGTPSRTNSSTDNAKVVVPHNPVESGPKLSSAMIQR